MTKKDYIALATALEAVKPDPLDHTLASRKWGECVNAILEVCARDNPAFHRGRFLDACGVPNIGIK